MPTTLPERRPSEFSPSLRHILALGAATLLMIALMAYHARFKAWVSDALRAEFVDPAARVGLQPAFTAVMPSAAMAAATI
jgi:hypothetical protein